MDDVTVTSLVEDTGGVQELSAIGMLDLLNHDPRPTFILDETKPFEKGRLSVWLTYWNSALARVNDGKLLISIKGGNVVSIAEEQRPVRSEFHTWIATQGNSSKSYSHLGHKWTKFVLGSKWIVVSGAPTEASALPEEALLSRNISPSVGTTSVGTKFDWTAIVSPTKISPHAAWARSIDWSQTPLGPMSEWSPQLRSIANLTMQDPHPAVVFYGPDLIMIYNEVYSEHLGNLHPCMGHSARAVFATVWFEYFEPMIIQNIQGQTVERTDLAIHMIRNGFMEETYFSMRFIPILDSDGATVGHYEPLLETVSFLGANLCPDVWVSCFVDLIATMCW